MLGVLPRKKYEFLKELVYKLDHGRCHICRKHVQYERATLDHVIPVANMAWGGIVSSCDEYWNIRIAHHFCNSKRGMGKSPGQLRLNLPI